MLSVREILYLGLIYKSLMDILIIKETEEVSNVRE
jgi:hypothetical protein